MSDDLLVRNLGADVKQRLRVRAAAHGRSLVAEAREILTAALDQTDEQRPQAPADQAEEGFGTRVARLFAGLGLREDEIPEIHGVWTRPVDFSFDE